MKRHVVLVGLPGSGKTAVGRLVALELEAPFVDLDQAIAERAGASIAQIFATAGERGFRELERAAMGRALAGAPSVIAPGGGWAAEPETLDGVRETSVVVYLKTSPDSAASRVARAGGRPLLEVPDPAARMKALHEAREPVYRRAEAIVGTDEKGEQEVAEEVVQLARTAGGW